MENLLTIKTKRIKVNAHVVFVLIYVLNSFVDIWQGQRGVYETVFHINFILFPQIIK